MIVGETKPLGASSPEHSPNRRHTPQQTHSLRRYIVPDSDNVNENGTKRAYTMTNSLERAQKVSGRWGCRPLVGMGVMEVTFEAAFQGAPNPQP